MRGAFRRGAQTVSTRKTGTPILDSAPAIRRRPSSSRPTRERPPFPPHSTPSAPPSGSSYRREPGHAAAPEPSRWRFSGSGCCPAPPHSPSPGTGQGRGSPTRTSKPRPRRSSQRPRVRFARRPATTGKPSSEGPPPQPLWARGSGTSSTMWVTRSAASNVHWTPSVSRSKTRRLRSRPQLSMPASTPSLR